MKLLRRKVYLRWYDFKKFILPKAYKVGYHRVEWTPLSIDDASKQWTMQLLKNDYEGSEEYMFIRDFMIKHKTHSFAFAYVRWLRRSKQLYDDSWCDWYWRVEDDSIELRYNKGHDWAALGQCVVERDYD